jgi:type IV pilus biogenesis protein CpaD/CtpE
MTALRQITITTLCVALLALGGCKPPRSMPNESVIGYDGHDAVPPDCANLTRSSNLTDAGFGRPSMAWGCAYYTDLAAQIANPKDLVEPRKLGPADAAVAASAVSRYETGRVIPLDSETSRSSK